MSRSARRPSRNRVGPLPLLIAAGLLAAAIVPVYPRPVRGEAPDHLVVSELVTGGASASDEFIELYNPTAEPLPLEGLEVVYASASGLTVSHRAAWETGAVELPPGGHLLIANELGVYAGIADALYSSGMAATGGSVALRIQGASSAIDALGWGSAASTWLEGAPAPAPPAGGSVERLPGGPLGSMQDTDDNAADFVERLVPDPQNLASAPTPDPAAPSPSPEPSPSATPSPSSPTPAPTGSPAASISVATARALPDGTAVTIEATALTGSAFNDGGGYVADTSGGIAVLLSSGSFARAERLRISGTIDDRFSQRTLRAEAADVTSLGGGTEPAPTGEPTGSVDERVEGRLIRVAGTVLGSPTSLSAAIAYDIDDGTGPVRVVVGSTLGIDTTAWVAGARVELHGVVGQRDSTGSGTSGYRVQPRDPDDVLSVTGPSATASPGPSGSPRPSEPAPSASPPADGVVPIAEARSRPKNARVRVRGTVTMPPGIVDPVSAVIEDDSGAIVLRVGEETGVLARGDRIEVDGVRSTLRGMETLRITTAARHLGRASEPAPTVVRTGDAGEALEAHLVRIRGAVVATARRAPSGSLSFELDDGSGPLRVFLAARLGADAAGLVAGAWVEVTGVLGQETTGAQPLRGYRLWPRTALEVRIGASPGASTAPAGGDGQGAASSGGGNRTGESATATASLSDIDEAGSADLHVGATLVHGSWPELSLAGLLWDGRRLVAVASASEGVVAALLADRRPPVAVELTGPVAQGTASEASLPVVRLGSGPGQSVVRDAAPNPPRGTPPQQGAAWVSLVGRLVDGGASLRLAESETVVRVRHRCHQEETRPSGVVQVTGVGLPEPVSILVPCGGVRPAPGLARVAHAAASVTGPEHGDTQPVVDEGAAPVRDLRGIAAGLVAMAAVVVAGAGLAARRLDPGPLDADDGTADADVPEAEVDAAEPAPRPLALVGVPHERGHR